MCNFYMMYYTEGEAEYLDCMNNNLPRQAQSMPADSLVPLPPNPLLDEVAKGHHHHGGVDEHGMLTCVCQAHLEYAADIIKPGQ